MTTKIVQPEKGLQLYRDDKAYMQMLLDALALDKSEEAEINKGVLKAVLDKYDEILDCAENNKPFIASWYAYSAELLTAMDVPWWMFAQTGFLGIEAPHVNEAIDDGESLLGNDFCTVLRLLLHYIEREESPRPSALIALLHPCDGTTIVHQAIMHSKNWQDVPVFGADPPYGEDERSFKYYAEEMRLMADFVTEHTGKKLDIDRLREVIKESNKMYALWQEYNELRRAIPCPHDWTIGPAQAFAMATYYYPGKPGGVEWFEKLVDNAEHRVKAGIGIEGGEKIRVLWFDLLPLMWQFDIQPWLESEWGANIVMNMFGYTPYEPIDTKNEETMFRGMAKRSLTEYPMIRQARGVADNFLSDIERIVKDYSMDCVIWPGHMGHKDGSANVGMMREKCRQIGVPFLAIGLDLFDKRYTTPDEVKDKLSAFFTTVMANK